LSVRSSALFPITTPLEYTMPALSLKDLIKAIRATKTAAQEREAIQKESARIRAMLKEGGVEGR
jgi:hypothetical protein